MISFKLCELKQLKVFSLWYLASRARHREFLFLSLSIVLQTSDYLCYLQTLLYYAYYFWILELFVCGLDTLSNLCLFETKNGEYLLFWIEIVFLTGK